VPILKVVDSANADVTSANAAITAAMPLLSVVRTLGDDRALARHLQADRVDV
jgi:hypothetical protein